MLNIKKAKLKCSCQRNFEIAKKLKYINTHQHCKSIFLITIKK